MAARDTKLYAFAHLQGRWAPCGQLTLTEEGERLLASSFVYGSRYLERRHPLEVDPVALSLKDPSTLKGRALLPALGLPFFGGIRDAAPDAWGRRVIEAKLRVPANSLPESQYLLHAGSDRVGALDVRDSLAAGPTAGAAPEHSLGYLLEAADRIEQGLPVPAQLDVIFNGGTALGGARPKASVRDEAGVLWIAKFPSRTDRMSLPTLEAATLRLAAHAGIEVPAVRTASLGAREVMLIRRFDRYWAHPDAGLAPDDRLGETTPGAGNIEHRLGFVSGLTLLARDEMASAGSTYGELAAAVRRCCHPSVIRANNAELFRRMVFNVFVTNDDDHLRNHGFVFDPRLPGWRLSPVYDVTPQPRSGSERLLHLGVGPRGREASLDNALAGCAQFTLSVRDAAGIVSEVWRIVRRWRTWFDEFGVAPEEQDRVAGAFRHIDDISSPDTRRSLG
jgi:serine/threonine-protein kinase HipA